MRGQLGECIDMMCNDRMVSCAEKLHLLHAVHPRMDIRVPVATLKIP